MKEHNEVDIKRQLPEWVWTPLMMVLTVLLWGMMAFGNDLMKWMEE